MYDNLQYHQNISQAEVQDWPSKLAIFGSSEFIHAFLHKESKVVEIWERVSSNALTQASKIDSDKFFENFKNWAFDDGKL